VRLSQASETQPRFFPFTGYIDPRCAAKPIENTIVASDDTNTQSAAGRYASALFDLAKEQKQVAAVESDLSRFAALLDGSADLQRLVLSPVFSADEQSNALTAVLAKANIAGLAGNFLRLLARNRRLFAVSDMIKSYRAIAAKDRGEQMNALRDQLKASVGKDVAIAAKVDPSLLGGLIVKVGSRMIDSSLKTKLSMLKVAMKGTG
jgi:F-type H+-transporting ATPase subunit delta